MADHELTNEVREQTIVRNASGEVIPSFAVMRVTGSATYNNAPVVTVDKPDGSGEQHLINGPSQIPIGKAGVGYRSYGKRALYDTGDGTPAHGETWGPKSGQWGLAKDEEGFEIVGGADNGAVRVMIPGGGGSAAEYFDCRIINPQSLTAGGLESRGYGVVTLYEAGSGLSLTAGADQVVEWPPADAVTPASGKAIIGRGVVDGVVGYSTGTASVASGAVTLSGGSLPDNVGVGHTFSCDSGGGVITAKASGTSFTIGDTGFSATDEGYTVSGPRYVLEAADTCNPVDVT